MKLKGQKAVVCGAGGFIGGHLVQSLLANGVDVIRAVDIKPLDEWYQVSKGVESLSLDLKDKDSCLQAAAGTNVIFQLAADMGGMGFIENNKALCMLSVLTNTHMLMAAREKGVERFFYSSSACVYNGEKQTNPDVVALKEEDAYPALPEDGYGWEKLFSERMCRHFEEDYGLQTRVARYHNVYGPLGTWTGGREKAPAAVCRKVIEAKHSGKHEIEIWGDGKQTRSFMYIDDCTKGTQMIAESEIHEPLNLGSDELVTINQLVDIAEDIAGIKLKRNYNLSAPKGVNGRNSDNTLIQEKMNWAPSIRLRDGLAKTYAWIEDEILAAKPLAAATR
ncbi:NAD-dependent epimerase/dehydratase family protein [Tunturiibacter gelidoferens]|uniref:Nucleoside-diphosphate-sugar epimerase n=1 Tax=Tunturiibacter gelidiferens TaxID=3069689 RepID=A0ACC5NX13_9BACT|nr:NAD-dependent epimerase/dehydratase family protein [Edaphobacter lichenicola]MBB5339124.1 nucleoside-diphosphate-sugar epimerase [Edaphobacter lichenicola]